MQGSSVVCCHSGSVTWIHSIMTTSLPRVKLSRFSVVTIVYHTYTGTWYLERNTHFDKLPRVPYKPQGSKDNHRYKWYGSLWNTVTTMHALACWQFWWPLAKVQGYASKITFIITVLSRWYEMVTFLTASCSINLNSFEFRLPPATVTNAPLYFQPHNVSSNIHHLKHRDHILDSNLFLPSASTSCG